MAEFSVVLREWQRMCAEFERMDGCNDCPITCEIPKSYGCHDMMCYANNTDEYERIIMAWAAEHPVVYPTWGEWFVEHGDLVDGWQNATNAAWMANTALSIFMKPIPADIAEKLGIKPKEGT